MLHLSICGLWSAGLEWRRVIVDPRYWLRGRRLSAVVVVDTTTLVGAGVDVDGLATFGVTAAWRILFAATIG